jgi:hypothetical protein
MRCGLATAAVNNNKKKQKQHEMDDKRIRPTRFSMECEKGRGDFRKLSINERIILKLFLNKQHV